MTHPDDWDKIFPQERGPKHYKNFKVQPFEFISKNELTFFQGCVVKYACRYKMKDGIKAVSYTHLTLPTIYSV